MPATSGGSMPSDEDLPPEVDEVEDEDDEVYTGAPPPDGIPPNVRRLIAGTQAAHGGASLYADPGGYDPVPPGYDPAMMGGGQQQPVRIPLWPRASVQMARGYYRLRIQRREPDGHVVDLGYLPADAGEAELVSKWATPGTYLISPVDEHGSQVERMPRQKIISPDHELLRAADTIRGSGESGIAGAPSLAPDLLRWVREQQRRMEETLAEERKRLDEANQRLADEYKRLSDQKLALAVESTTNQNEHHAKLLDMHGKREEHSRKQVEATFSTVMSTMESGHARAMEMERVRADEARARMEADLAQRKMDLEAEKLRVREERLEREERMREERRERDERIDRERKEERDRAERERARDKEHQEMMLKLIAERQEAKNPMAALSGIIAAAAPVAKALGIDLKDVGSSVLPMMLGGGPKGWIEVVGETVKSVVDAQARIQEARIKTLGEEPDDDDEDDEVVVQDGNGNLLRIPMAQFRQMQAQQQAMMRQPQQVAAQQGAQQVQGPQPQTAAQPATPAEPPEYAALRQLPPKIVKSARIAVREAVGALKAAAPGDRAAVIVALLGGPAGEDVLALLKATSIRFALRDGGADEGLTSEVCAQVDAMGVVPNDIKIR